MQCYRYRGQSITLEIVFVLLPWALGIEPGSSGLWGKCFYLLSHLDRSPPTFEIGPHLSLLTYYVTEVGLELCLSDAEIRVTGCHSQPPESVLRYRRIDTLFTNLAVLVHVWFCHLLSPHLFIMNILPCQHESFYFYHLFFLFTIETRLHCIALAGLCRPSWLFTEISLLLLPKRPMSCNVYFMG